MCMWCPLAEGKPAQRLKKPRCTAVSVRDVSDAVPPGACVGLRRGFGRAPGRVAQPSTSRPRSGPARRSVRRDTADSRASRWVGRAPACSAGVLTGANWPPVLVDNRMRVAVDVARIGLKVFSPQPQSGVAGQHRIAGDDVDLGVVEQGVLVEVGRAEVSQRSSTIADLGVHVQRPLGAPGLRAWMVVASSRPAPSSASSRTPSWPRVVSAPLSGLAGQQSRIRNSLARRVGVACRRGSSTISATTGTGSRDR